MHPPLDHPFLGLVNTGTTSPPHPQVLSNQPMTQSRQARRTGRSTAAEKTVAELPAVELQNVILWSMVTAKLPTSLCGGAVFPLSPAADRTCWTPLGAEYALNREEAVKAGREENSCRQLLRKHS